MAARTQPIGCRPGYDGVENLDVVFFKAVAVRVDPLSDSPLLVSVCPVRGSLPGAGVGGGSPGGCLLSDGRLVASPSKRLGPDGATHFCPAFDDGLIRCLKGLWAGHCWCGRVAGAVRQRSRRDDWVDPWRRSWRRSGCSCRAGGERVVGWSGERESEALLVAIRHWAVTAGINI